GDSGANPTTDLVLATDGSLYGVANGGASGSGVLFRTDGDGNNFEVLHSFVFGEGSGPMGIVPASDGLLYGTLVSGGDFFSGTVYSFDPQTSALTVLRSLSNSDGTYPQACVIEGADGLLYGSASNGGSFFSGTVYRLEKSGANFTVLYEF